MIAACVHHVSMHTAAAAAAALLGALVDLSWSFAMLGHLPTTMAKECFKALGLVPPEVLDDAALVMLWDSHMRYQQLGHVMLDPNPLLAESYSVFAREVGGGCVCVCAEVACFRPTGGQNAENSHSLLLL